MADGAASDASTAPCSERCRRRRRRGGASSAGASTTGVTFHAGVRTGDGVVILTWTATTDFTPDVAGPVVVNPNFTG